MKNITHEDCYNALNAMDRPAASYEVAEYMHLTGPTGARNVAYHLLKLHQANQVMRTKKKGNGGSYIYWIDSQIKEKDIKRLPSARIGWGLIQQLLAKYARLKGEK